MLIYKEMTYTEWQDLRKRTEAALSVDTKEYYSLVKLFSEWTCSQSAIDQFSRGEPERYIARLRDVLKKLKDKEKYPALITVDGGLKKRISVFHLPTSTMAQILGTPVPEKTAPKVPENWARFSRYEDYRKNLSDALRREGDDNLVAWMTNRSRLHETAKKLERSGASEQALEEVIKELDQQELCIQNYFDRVENFMNGKEEELPVITSDTKPSGKYTKAQIDKMTDLVFAAKCVMMRIEANRKYLRRRDLSNKEEMELRKQELKEWGIDVNSLIQK